MTPESESSSFRFLVEASTDEHGVDPTDLETFHIGLRNELASTVGLSVEPIHASPPPEGARGLELAAVIGYLIATGEVASAVVAITQVVDYVRRWRRSDRRRRDLSVKVGGVPITDAGTPAEEARRIVDILRPGGLPAPRSPVDRTGRRKALIVANSRYDDAALTRLRSPSSDARALGDVLQDPDIGGFDVELMIDVDERTLRRGISRFFADRDPDDLLLLHFSCHGLKDVDGQLYLAASDTELDHISASAVPAGFVSTAMSRSAARRVVVMFDCCYSGAFARGMGVRGDSQVHLSDYFSNGSGRTVLTASSATEYAFEDSELTSNTPEPSIFTGAIVEGLRTGNADLDGDGDVSVDELYEYARRRIAERGSQQRPQKWNFETQGAVVIARSNRLPDLPTNIADDMRHPRVEIRESAVRQLAALLQSEKRGMREVAQGALRQMSQTDDSHSLRGLAERALAGLPTPSPTLPAQIPPSPPSPTPPRPSPTPPRPSPTPPPSTTRPPLERPERSPQLSGSGQGERSMPGSEIPTTRLIAPGALLIGAALVSLIAQPPFTMKVVSPWALAVVGLLMLAGPAGSRPGLAGGAIGASLPFLPELPLHSLLADGDFEGDFATLLLQPAMILAAAGLCVAALRPVVRRGRLAWGWPTAVALLASLVVVVSAPARPIGFGFQEALQWAQVVAELAFVPTAAALAVALVPRGVGLALIGGFTFSTVMVSTAATVKESTRGDIEIDPFVVWTLLTLAALVLLAVFASLRVQPSTPPTVAPPAFSPRLVAAAGAFAVVAAILASPGLVASVTLSSDTALYSDYWRLALVPASLSAGLGIAAAVYRSPVLVGLFAALMGWSSFDMATYGLFNIRQGGTLLAVLTVAAELIILLAIVRAAIRNGVWHWGTAAAVLSAGTLSAAAVRMAEYLPTGRGWLGALSLAVVALAAAFRGPTYLGAALLGGLGVGGLILLARWSPGGPISYLAMLVVVVIAAGLAWLARRQERGDMAPSASL